jgi:hypothetical protein
LRRKSSIGGLFLKDLKGGESRMLWLSLQKARPASVPFKSDVDFKLDGI